MCGGCPFCGQTTYGYIGHASREQCVNALKGALRSAQEGREMVRETLTIERDRYRQALDVVAEGTWVEGDPIAMRDFARAALALDEQREAPEGGTR